MKILFTTFLFFGILLSFNLKDNINSLDNLECTEGSMDYCTGYVDGLEAQSGVPMSGAEYARRHSKCMTGRGCSPHFPQPIST